MFSIDTFVVDPCSGTGMFPRAIMERFPFLPLSVGHDLEEGLSLSSNRSDIPATQGALSLYCANAVAQASPRHSLPFGRFVIYCARLGPPASSLLL